MSDAHRRAAWRIALAFGIVLVISGLIWRRDQSPNPPKPERGSTAADAGAQSPSPASVVLAQQKAANDTRRVESTVPASPSPAAALTTMTREAPDSGRAQPVFLSV